MVRCKGFIMAPDREDVRWIFSRTTHFPCREVRTLTDSVHAMLTATTTCKERTTDKNPFHLHRMRVEILFGDVVLV